MGLVRGFLIGLGLLLAAATPAHASIIYAASGGAVSTVGTVSGLTGPVASGGPVGFGADLAATPDGKTVYVAADQLAPLDTTTNILGPAIALPGRPKALAMTPDGTTLLAATESAVTRVATANQQPGASGKLKPKTRYHYRLVAATDGAVPPVANGADLSFRTATTGTLRVRARTLRLRGKSVNVALRCQSRVACRGKITLTSGRRTCASGTLRLKAKQRAHKRLTVRRSCREKRSARLRSTVTTGQKDLAVTVRIRR
jgi:hypothetical protein